MKQTEKKAKYRGPAILILSIGIFISMFALVVYLTETDFSDETLFFLLAVLRYSSFFVCICSVYLLVDSIVFLVRSPSLLNVIRMIVSLCCVLYGSGILIMDAFINSFSEGIG
jgi:hypothetical protein